MFNLFFKDSLEKEDEYFLDLKRSLLLGKDIYDKCKKGESVDEDDLEIRLIELINSNLISEKDCSLKKLISTCNLKITKGNLHKILDKDCILNNITEDFLRYNLHLNKIDNNILLYIYQHYKAPLTFYIFFIIIKNANEFISKNKKYKSTTDLNFEYDRYILSTQDLIYKFINTIDYKKNISPKDKYDILVKFQSFVDNLSFDDNFIYNFLVYFQPYSGDDIDILREIVFIYLINVIDINKKINIEGRRTDVLMFLLSLLKYDRITQDELRSIAIKINQSNLDLPLYNINKNLFLYKPFRDQLKDNVKTYDKALNKWYEELAEHIENFDININMPQILTRELYKTLIDKGLIDDISYEEYMNEWNERHIQGEIGLEGVNVHSRSTNFANNKIIKKLFENEQKIPLVKDELDEKRTIEAIDEFLEVLNNNNIQNNLSKDDLLLCKNYFYDYADKLIGRDKTSAGEGVEVCNIFLKIWNKAKSQLNEEQLKDFSIRLKEEFESILQKLDNKNNPVCSTGWATRLINSLVGTEIDLGFIAEPDVNVIKQDLANWLEKKRNEMEEGSKEADKFDASYIMLEDKFNYIKSFIKDHKKEFVDKIYNDYKDSNIKKIKINTLLKEAQEQLLKV